MPTVVKNQLEGDSEGQDYVNVEQPHFDIPPPLKHLHLGRSFSEPRILNRTAMVVDTTCLLGKLKEVYETLTLDKESRLNHLETCKLFYRMQAMHKLGTEADVIKIPVFFLNDNLNRKWKTNIRNAINDINLAAPGLHLYIVLKQEDSIIVIVSSSDGCYTAGNIFITEQCTIGLDNNWQGSWKGTGTHELLHAIGFQHEMKRLYASLYLIENSVSEWKMQYKEEEGYWGITRFDPLSIMMYPESEMLQRKQDADPVWKLKNFTGRSEVMSELDKVGLNLLFRPCKRETYNPSISSSTKFLYCGRNVTEEHNNPAPSMTDGRCGPTNGPNCSACRVLKVPRSSKRERCVDIEGKWQGWSGEIYCGESNMKATKEYRIDPSTGKVHTIINDGTCGPNNGKPCNSCGKELYASYDYNNYYGEWPVAKRLRTKIHL